MDKKFEKDPIRRFVEKKGTSDEALSPMDPPDAYSPPNSENIDKESLHPMLRDLVTDHSHLEQELKTFEDVLLHMQQEGISPDSNSKLKHFFEFFDHSVWAHNRKEEDLLFPILKKRLVEKGEHSNGDEKTTCVDILLNEHAQFIQISAVSFNLFALCTRLPDEKSRLIVLDSAIEQGKDLVEKMRLHAFREDNIAIPLAQKHLTTEELDTLISV